LRRRGAIGAGPALLLGTTMFFWGTAFRATAIGAAHASPTVFSALRAIPATLVLCLVVALTRARLPRERRMLALAILSGPLVVSFTFEGIAESTKLAGAGNSAVLINTAPFFTVLLAHALLGQRTRRIAIGGLMIGFAGVVVMVSSQLGATGSVGKMALGMAIALAAAAGFAGGALITGRAAAIDPDLDMLGFTTVQYVVGATVLVALAGIAGNIGRTDWGSPALLGSVAWVAFGSSAAASVCFNLALRRVSATRATAWQFLAPAVAVVVEAARGNAPGVPVVIGMALAIAGVAIVSVSAAEPAATEPMLVHEVAPESRSVV
jgi:drug/metabolite transporter (DMT)-like permease